MTKIPSEKKIRKLCKRLLKADSSLSSKALRLEIEKHFGGVSLKEHKDLIKQRWKTFKQTSAPPPQQPSSSSSSQKRKPRQNDKHKTSPPPKRRKISTMSSVAVVQATVVDARSVMINQTSLESLPQLPVPISSMDAIILASQISALARPSPNDATLAAAELVFLRSCDRAATSSRDVRKHLEKQFGVSLSDRKKLLKATLAEFESQLVPAVSKSKSIKAVRKKVLAAIRTDTSLQNVGRTVTKGVRRKRSNWTQPQTDLLHEAVEAHGTGHWTTVVDEYDFGDRCSQDLRDKWRNIQLAEKRKRERDGLPPAAKKAKKSVFWSTSEVDTLIAGYKQHGPKWSKILKDDLLAFHRSRTSSNLKEKWTNLKTVANKDKKHAKPNKTFLIVDEDHKELRSVQARFPSGAMKFALSSDPDLENSAADFEVRVLEQGAQAVHVFRIIKQSGTASSPQPQARKLKVGVEKKKDS